MYINLFALLILSFSLFLLSVFHAFMGLKKKRPQALEYGVIVEGVFSLETLDNTVFIGWCTFAILHHFLKGGENMNKTCKFCNGTGKKISGIPFSGGHFIKVPCKKCHGTGRK